MLCSWVSACLSLAALRTIGTRNKTEHQICLWMENSSIDFNMRNCCGCVNMRKGVIAIGIIGSVSLNKYQLKLIESSRAKSRHPHDVFFLLHFSGSIWCSERQQLQQQQTKQYNHSNCQPAQHWNSFSMLHSQSMPNVEQCAISGAWNEQPKNVQKVDRFLWFRFDA